MHYYKFNIADWHLATSHLSLEEEAIYFRLINYYYDTEQAIPEETQSVIRRLRLGSNSEIVGIILKEFFTILTFDPDENYNLNNTIIPALSSFVPPTCICINRISSSLPVSVTSFSSCSPICPSQTPTPTHTPTPTRTPTPTKNNWLLSLCTGGGPSTAIVSPSGPVPGPSNYLCLVGIPNSTYSFTSLTTSSPNQTLLSVKGGACSGGTCP